MDDEVFARSLTLHANYFNEINQISDIACTMIQPFGEIIMLYCELHVVLDKEINLIE